MLDHPLKYALLAGLAIALFAAAATDLRSRRIGNWLTGAIALGAPLFWWASGLSIWPDGFFEDDRLIVAGLGGMVWMSIGAFIMAKMVTFEI